MNSQKWVKTATGNMGGRKHGRLLWQQAGWGHEGGVPWELGSSKATRRKSPVRWRCQIYEWMRCNISAVTSTCRGLSCSAKTKFTFTVTLKVTCKGGFYKYLTRSNASSLTAPPLAFLKLSPNDLWPPPFSSLQRRTFHISNGNKKNKKKPNVPTPCRPWTQLCFKHQWKKFNWG